MSGPGPRVDPDEIDALADADADLDVDGLLDEIEAGQLEPDALDTLAGTESDTSRSSETDVDRNARGDPVVHVAPADRSRSVYHVDKGCHYLTRSRTWNLEVCRRVDLDPCSVCGVDLETLLALERDTAGETEAGDNAGGVDHGDL